MEINKIDESTNNVELHHVIYNDEHYLRQLVDKSVYWFLDEQGLKKYHNLMTRLDNHNFIETEFIKHSRKQKLERIMSSF